jgi:AraC family transcriptional regulator
VPALPVVLAPASPAAPAGADQSPLLLPAVSGAGQTWRSIAALRFSQAIDEVELPPLPHHTVMVNVGRPFSLEERLGGRVYRTSGGSGDVAIIPAGVPSSFRRRERARQQVDSFAMFLDPAAVRRLAAAGDLDPDGIELHGVLGGRDQEIERIARALLAELQTGGLLGELYADTLANALAIHLLRGHSSLGQRVERQVAPENAAGLSRAEPRRVADFVDAQLGRSLTLAELAAVVHRSPFHFSRLFRQSTGHSPHQKAGAQGAKS